MAQSGLINLQCVHLDTPRLCTYSLRKKPQVFQSGLSIPRKQHVQIRPEVLRKSIIVQYRSSSAPISTILTDPASQIRVSLPPETVLSDIQFTEVRQGRNKSICVQYVLSGSPADKAGVAPGQQLMAISDPIRYTEMIELRDSPSPRFVRDAIRLRRGPTIDLVFSSPSLEKCAESSSAALPEEGLLDAVVNSAAVGSGGISASASNNGGETGTPTIAEKLEAEYGAKMSAAERRMKRRKEYMGEVADRNDGPLFAGLLSLFVLPAVVILAIAYFSGYLDSLSGGYNSY